MTQIANVGWHTNCYLLATKEGYILIDTEFIATRQRIARKVAAALAAVNGDGPRRLALIVCTHGDSDHIGNAAYLRARFGAPVAMHSADVPMAELGECYASRTTGSPLARAFLGPIMCMRPADCFTPDVLLEEGDSLLPWGLDAHVLHLPGHTPGSIGILTAEGDLFCGDLITRSALPGWRAMVDEAATVRTSIARIRMLPLRTIYPGHRQPFTLAELSDRGKKLS